ncbi:MULTISPECIES: helix-turn-helix domain-containing protein [Methylobacteriaceae]|jgi:hypothetical protein|uniref:Helix-turn-helix domain-containing protein n=1 Tax=Methylobacterium persicinum TaxID=374426 RepID=A0ABU0HRB2_9HYPH|nr:helix-turn-helix domain-containing protein [Methylobacterium persicinum]MDQ0444857.1 hypothetical protein [Methylobacterium persicinum]GJE36047.1 hypothetical protein KHHGKMAE_0093 [Methylobacterium persicinum]
MFADELRRAIEAASRITLPQVTALLWRAYGDGRITEVEAEGLSGLIEARTLAASGSRAGQTQNPTGTSAAEVGDPSKTLVGRSRRSVGSRPRTAGSMERRRRWAASGRMPLAIAARFTQAEQAVLAIVAAETARRGDCRMAVGHIAAVAGVAETTVRNAIREARTLGMVTVEERRLTGFRNDTNIVRIVSAEWTAWLRLARKGSVPQGGGCNSVKRTPTQVSILLDSGKTAPSQSCRGTAVDLKRADPLRIRAGGGRVRAMR